MDQNGLYLSHAATLRFLMSQVNCVNTLIVDFGTTSSLKLHMGTPSAVSDDGGVISQRRAITC
jgi:hypothetical protein